MIDALISDDSARTCVGRQMCDVEAYKRSAEYKEWKRTHTWGGFLWPDPDRRAKRAGWDENEYLAGEVAWLRDGGVSVPLICQQLHRSADTIAHMLRRHGRPEYASAFEAEAKYLRERHAA